LDPRDRLFIVHVGKNQQAGWKVGGPLIADLDTALASYPHETVELEGSLQSNVRSFVEKLGIDLIVLSAPLAASRRLASPPGVRPPASHTPRRTLPCPCPQATASRKSASRSGPWWTGSSNM
jgi:hypothetical protein